MLEAEIKKLVERAKADRKAKIDAANRDYVEEMNHIKWLRGRVGANGVSVTHVRRKATGRFAASKPTNQEPKAEEYLNSLAGGIKLAVRELKQFTADDVAEWLDKRKPELRAAQRRNTISVGLSRLRRDEWLDVVSPGLRGKAQVFRLREGTK